MAAHDPDISMAAMQAVLMALIRSHPDRKKLLSTFDRMLSEQQVAALAVAGTKIPPEFREALEVWRKQIEGIAPGTR